MKTQILLLISLMLVILSGCSDDTDHISLQEELDTVLRDADINVERLLHYEVKGDGVVAFYVNDNGIDSSYVEYNSGEWQLIGSSGSATLMEPDLPISYVWEYTNDKPFRNVFGSINQEEITQVLVNGEPAKIIRIGDEITLWYQMLEEPYLNEDTLEAFSNRGELVFKKD